MKTVRAIHSTLKKTFEWFESVEKQDNNEVTKFLHQYIHEGRRVFEWDDCEYKISQILNFKHVDYCVPLFTHLKDPTAENYRTLIGERYYSIAENMVTALSGEVSRLSPNEIAMTYFTSLAYYPVDEQILVLESLISTEADETVCWEEMDSSHTLIPLALTLACDHTLKGATSELREKIDDLLNNYPLNTRYSDAYNGFLSADSELVKGLFKQLCQYHLEKSADNPKGFPEFEFPVNQAFPEEIIVLLNLRIRNGLDNSMVDHPLLDPFLPFIDIDQTDTNIMTSDQRHLRNVIFNEFDYKQM